MDLLPIIKKLEVCYKKSDVDGVLSSFAQSLNCVEECLSSLLQTDLRKLLAPRRKALSDIIDKYRRILSKCASTSSALRKETMQHRIVLYSLRRKLEDGSKVTSEDKFQLKESKDGSSLLGELSKEFQELILLIGMEQQALETTKAEAEKRKKLFLTIAIVAGAVVVGCVILGNSDSSLKNCSNNVTAGVTSSSRAKEG